MTDDEPTADAGDGPDQPERPTDVEAADADSTDAADADSTDATESGDDLPPVKTDDEGKPIRRSAHPVEWESVGRKAIVDLLRKQRDAVVRDVEEVIGAIEFGARVDPVHVLHARDAIEALELTMEERVVPVTRDKESWERTMGRVPRGRMYDALDLSRTEVNRLKEQREAEEESEVVEE